MVNLVSPSIVLDRFPKESWSSPQDRLLIFPQRGGPIHSAEFVIRLGQYGVTIGLSRQLPVVVIVSGFQDFPPRVILERCSRVAIHFHRLAVPVKRRCFDQVQAVVVTIFDS
jgi:hypothetical protein